MTGRKVELVALTQLQYYCGRKIGSFVGSGESTWARNEAPRLGYVLGWPVTLSRRRVDQASGSVGISLDKH